MEQRISGRLFQLIVELLDIVLSSQLVYFDGELYIQVTGITTGLNCACQLANIYLRSLDIYIKHAWEQHLWAYKRFIDDIIVFTDLVGEALDALLHAFNSWHPNILCTSNGVVKNPHFLEFSLHLSASADDRMVVNYNTYRKPGCLYLYTPGNE